MPETLQRGVRSDLGKHIALDIWMLVRAESCNFSYSKSPDAFSFISLFYLIFSPVFFIIKINQTK